MAEQTNKVDEPAASVKSSIEKAITKLDKKAEDETLDNKLKKATDAVKKATDVTEKELEEDSSDSSAEEDDSADAKLDLKKAALRRKIKKIEEESDDEDDVKIKHLERVKKAAKHSKALREDLEE